ncbi:MAG: hypothetical protein M1830_007250 [Pleopsidium flavum]|nr:MAG: hypothetical protein M1830_007250 [Pleopsidium flavum]
MREDATRIFYSRNHFIARPHLSVYGYNTITPTRVGISQFLTRLPRNALKNLCSIQWVLPDFGNDYLLPGEDASLDWLNTIDFIAHNTDLSRLSLTMDMSNELLSYHFAYEREQEAIDQEEAMWATYQRVLEPMVQLKSLQNLFLHLSWPLNPRKENLRHQQERILEKRVMGEDYDSIPSGKVLKRQ